MLAMLATLAALAADPSPEPQIWAGHQRTVGTRQVPLLGEIRTVTDVYMVANVQDSGSEITLVETPCSIEIAGAAGVKLTFDPAAVKNIPPPTIRFVDTEGALSASWTGGWGEGDVDGDGAPGFRVGVRAPVCSGHVAIGSNTESTADARRHDGGIVGEVKSVIRRRVLDWSNACLGLVSKQQQEPVSGRFRYQPAPPDTTCATAKFPSLDAATAPTQSP
jgi:hypothetical protein